MGHASSVTKRQKEEVRARIEDHIKEYESILNDPRIRHDRVLFSPPETYRSLLHKSASLVDMTTGSLQLAYIVRLAQLTVATSPFAYFQITRDDVVELLVHQDNPALVLELLRGSPLCRVMRVGREIQARSQAKSLQHQSLRAHVMVLALYMKRIARGEFTLAERSKLVLDYASEAAIISVDAREASRAQTDDSLHEVKEDGESGN